MDLTRFSLRTRMLTGFLSMACLTVALGVVSIYQLNQLAGITRDIYDHPLTVGYAIRDLRGYVWSIHSQLTRASEHLTAGQVDALENKIAELDQKAMGLIAVLGERYLGNQAQVAAIKEDFEAWRSLRDEKFGYLRQKTWLEHEADYTLKSNRFADDLVAKCQAVADFTSSKARFFYESAETKERHALMVLATVVVLLVMIKMSTGFLITNSIINPLGVIVARLRDIARGDFRQDVDISRGDEIGTLADSFRDMRRSLKSKSETAEAVASGDLGKDPEPAGPNDILGKALLRMTESLRRGREENQRKDWHKTGLNELSAGLAGIRQPGALADAALGFLTRYLKAQVGAFYVADQDGLLTLAGSFAFTKRKDLAANFAPGQGIVGQTAKEGKSISLLEVPEDYLPIASSLGRTHPRNVVTVPMRHEGQVLGVLELGALEVLDEDRLAFLDAAGELVAVSLSGIQYNAKLEELLKTSRDQAEQLQRQQEALRVANEELEEQAQVLRTSEEELKQQQEEMQVINEELEEKNQFLERQESTLAERNRALETARADLERKAGELQQASRYKSEFLANMSHELRTPLNSLLILSRNLSDNPTGNLTPDQVESAAVINQSGTDLLSLINDILDLSRIEAGKITIHFSETNLDEVAANLGRYFEPLAAEKGLSLAIDRDPDVPRVLNTDVMRLEQILRNLLGNAVKFTERGSVSLRVVKPAAGTVLTRPGLRPESAVAFQVSDTGIGIPLEKQAQIFEAFQQADGSITRRFGGAGLGLSISRELASLLGGEMTVESHAGEGAVFTLYLPLEQATQAVVETPPLTPGPPQSASDAPRPFTPPSHGWDSSVSDDRAALPQENDKAILIVEDDNAFAKILRDLCRDKGFKALVAPTGQGGLELARTLHPAAVILDLKLPDIDGWEVMRQLKSDAATRHLPIHIISVQEAGLDALRQGAIGFLTKPVTREDLDQAFGRIESVLSKKVKELLVVEDNAAMRRSIVDLITDSGVQAVEASSGEEALAALAGKPFDCMVLDLGLPDMSGFELLKRLEAESGEIPIPPVVIYTGRDLTREEEMELRRYSESIIVKGARSEERLLDEATLFLHSMVGNMPQSKQRMLRSLRDPNAALDGKTVLIVDDDMRNLFAVSRLLEGKGLKTRKAENGEKALELLDKNPDVDLVLLDIMMPVMDGYQTLARLRAEPRFATLPVIALTAKAMKEDRDNCLAAGASDYLAKPVDVERLFSILRVWLSR